MMLKSGNRPLMNNEKVVSLAFRNYVTGKLGKLKIHWLAKSLIGALLFNHVNVLCHGRVMKKKILQNSATLTDTHGSTIR